MIVYELRCGADHAFEGWFRNSDAYDAQVAAGQVACPHCADTNVRKAPMAPAIVKGGQRKQQAQARVETEAETKPAVPQQSDEVRQFLTKVNELCRAIEQRCVYVGADFAEEARKIHYGEVEHRDIYGETTTEEAEALQEEGIEVASVPWIPRSDA